MKQILLAIVLIFGLTATAQERTMKVYKNGEVTHRILISNIDSVKIESNIINGHEYVDLGLPSGLLWATCNIGATNPEDYGDYYAWGETTTKPSYTSFYSTTYGVSMSDISGNAEYDAARANWGGTWRIPTKTEIEELIDKCTWEWTAQNGVNGYKVTGSNGSSIFLPAAGFCYGSSLFNAGSYSYYWSSTPYESDTNDAYYLDFNSGKYYRNHNGRDRGHSVRPVSK